jgi:4-hydroxy-tetrahydrodipicolinate reductase
LNIALIGFGKMGKAIEQIALQNNHNIFLKITSINNLKDNIEALKSCQVAIEFSNPESAFNNVLLCLQNNIPVVCGTTGWTEKLPEINKEVVAHNGSFLYASNFSLGVNIFFMLNTYLAKIMASNPAYLPSIHEVHHTQKKDAPSGTAITLAHQILAQNKSFVSFATELPTNKNELYISHERIDPAPGTHTINYKSLIDDITITHTAHNREGFAKGAVLAAEYIANKKGIFTMVDVLELPN